MRYYENIFIVRPDATNSQVEQLASDFSGIITNGDGEISKTEFCGLRNLAYKIKKHRKGHYVLFNIKAQPAVIQEMERKMKLSEDVLRYLTIHVETLDPNPSPLMQQKYYRDAKLAQDESIGAEEEVVVDVEEKGEGA